MKGLIENRLGAGIAALILCLAYVSAPAADPPALLADKTLVAWVSPANLTQGGGSVLSIDDQHGHFDGIIFGEIARGKWMAGSDGFRRTQRDQASWPAETADPQTQVQLAAVYRGREITLVRNGSVYAQYQVEEPQTFGPESVIVLGLRHLDVNERACFQGLIDDVRIYPAALQPAAIAALRPHERGQVEPLAWFTFQDGRLTDRMGRFARVTVNGDVQIAGAKLRLPGKESFVVAERASGGAMSQVGASTAPWQSATTATLIPPARELRRRLQADPHRPRYHFVTPEGNCMPFDPNGALWWQGRYHLMYIVQEYGKHCWGHASSHDLLHWTIHPVALAPQPGDVDRGIFSGNAFVSRDGVPTIMYHGVGAGNCLAQAIDPDMIAWKKLPQNPIVPIPKKGDPDFGKYASWDPHAWRDGDRYYAIFGGAKPTIFRSSDLVRWQYVGPLMTDDRWSEPDEDVSCPDFFQLGDKYVLVCISHKRGARYFVGSWRDEQFHPEFHARMNWPGGTFFAPESLADEHGRRILWAWVLDRRAGPAIQASGYSGEMSLPRVLSWNSDDTLRIEPAEELTQLRQHPREGQAIALVPGKAQAIPGVEGDAWELSLELDPGQSQRCGLVVRRSPDDAERTVIEYDRKKQVLRIDLSKSTLDKSVVYRTYCMRRDNPEISVQEAPLELKPNEPLRLRIFLDRSMLEIFANDRQCVTQRIYPTRADSLGVQVFAEGGPAAVNCWEAWDMAPTNPW